PAKAAAVLTEGFAFVKSVPAFRYIAFSSVATLAVGLIVEFRFYNVSHAVIADPELYESFFSVYRFGFVLLSLLVETLAARRILAKLGSKNAFLILPLMAVAGSLAVGLAPGLLPVALLGLVVIRLPQNTVDELARKQFQGLVPEERRGRVSLLMDGYLYASGDILGCVACGIGVLLATAFSHPSFASASLALGVLLSIGAVAAGIALRRSWDVSLLNWRLQRRRRGGDLLNRLLDDPGATTS
ncbi:MAG TPA: hypothetical protein VFS62_08615, partial [Chloroflexota bacterium]|nr:hypothetical protein [Chloroflexota bacterium]